MQRWQRASIFAFGVIVLALAVFVSGYTLGRGGGTDTLLGPTSSDGGRLGIVRDAYEQIRSSAVEPPGGKELARGAVEGMVRVLKRHEDPYALFYTPKSYSSFQELTTGQFSGIGVWLKEKEGEPEVVSVLPATPALEAGLKRGDVISGIDGRATKEMSIDEVVNSIKGPAGTNVSLTVSREGRPEAFTITRQSIVLPNLRAAKTPEGLGYVRLFGFARGAGKQLRSKVSELTAEGVEGIVLDLRDNGGGLFSEAIDVSSVFLDEGKIVTYKTRREPDQVYEAEGNAFADVPLVVLVNEGTASASEIVAGALQDRNRAILVGDRTYGKGSVQEVFPLADASGLKLTTGAYFTPSGHNINGKGIDPDVQVPAAPGEQKHRAIEILRGIILSTDGHQG
ncbi:MAG: S41 family peptidase [Actinomycetota bacterium]